MTRAEYELTRLDPNTFEHLVNSLALGVLGAGHTGFGPGPDGGRDGFFEGSSNYPNEREAWTGTWYVQSKLHTPNLSKDHGKWLLSQLEEELTAFADSNRKRKWPDNYILATNIDPSGAPETGVFDQARELVKKYRPQLEKRFHIWGGAKIIDLIHKNEFVSKQYGEFVTAGYIIENIYKTLNDRFAGSDDILRNFLVTDFQSHIYSKLEQAGSEEDEKPPLEEIFTDLPFSLGAKTSLAGRALAKALAYPQALPDELSDVDLWDRWQRDPERARIWFIKGGPGQGKSTITQFIAQVQRACFILSPEGPHVNSKQKKHARNIKMTAENVGMWPIAPRIPVTVELKTYAQWFGEQSDKSTRVLTYLEHSLTRDIGQDVLAGTLKRIFSTGRWLFVFDGLDEVPGDIKDKVAQQIVHFVDNVLVGLGCDASVVCTSRPQGYSGQFEALQSANVTLSKLSPAKALACARPILQYKLSDKDSTAKIAVLEQALSSPSVASLMTTPLQSHIMAIIVRIGGRPPERKWKLFDRFYEVIKKRETDKDFPDARLNKLLRTQNKLIRALHNRLGFELHARAETKSGATTSLSRTDFEVVVRTVVSALQEIEIDETVSTLMEAATERLVLVNTPENGETVRFDIRQLQEFFAAEEISAAEPRLVAQRFQQIAGDSHWAEVTHFLLSGFIENERRLEISSAVVSLFELDEGHNETRDLHRRLARGGIIARGILVEGVLEHDRRVRNQFSNCFSALVSSSEAVNYLVNTPSEHSRAWLVQYLLRSLRENSEEETLGAATTLVALLDDDDPLSKVACELISEKSLPFKCAVLREFQFAEDESIAPYWALKIAVECLSDSGSFNEMSNIVNPIVSIIINRDYDESIFNGRFSSETSDIIYKILDYRDFEQINNHKKELICGGKVELHYVGATGVRDWRNWSADTMEELRMAGGYFKGIYLACEYIKVPDLANYKALFEFGSSLDWLRKLPSAISSYFNREKVRLASISIKSEEIIDNSPHVGTVRVLFHPETKGFSPEDWIDFIKNVPDHLDHYLSYGDRKLPDSVWQSNDLRQAVAMFDAEHIAVVVSNLPSPPPENLRSALNSRIKELGENGIGIAYVRRMSPFPLRLPSEAHFLPWIVNMISERASMDLVMDDDPSSYEGIARMARGYIANVDDLSNLIADDSVSTPIKAAAAIMSAYHPSPSELFLKCDWDEWYDRDRIPWLVPALCHAATPYIRAGHEGIMRKVSSIFALTRRDYMAKSASATVVASWRELAHQPVAGSPHELWDVVKD